MGDSYRILGSTSRAEIKVKGSRFIGEALPVGSPEEAMERLKEIRRREHDATHYCFAYRTGVDPCELRFSDDGEPSGTAGKPIMRQIESADVTNTMIVVTRYYGGTKLGTGGLMRAYGEAARASLEGAKVNSIVRRTNVRVSFAYADTSAAMYTIQKFDARIQSTDYGEETSILLGVERSRTDPFVKEFEDALAGRGTVSIVAENRPNHGIDE